MSTDHLVRLAADAAWAPAAGPLSGSTGFQAWSVVDSSTPAVHTGFGLGRLDSDGTIPAHVHAYEESMYVLGGEVVVQGSIDDLLRCKRSPTGQYLSGAREIETPARRRPGRTPT